MFGKKTKPAPAPVDEDGPTDLQAQATKIAEDFTDHDLKALAALTPDERAEETEIRWRLYRHVDKIWDAPHLRSEGIHPNEAGGYEAVAALRDLLGSLWADAQEAQTVAGDDIDTVSVDVTVKHEDDNDPDAP